MTPVQMFWLIVTCAAVPVVILGAAWVAVHLKMLNDLGGEDWYQ